MEQVFLKRPGSEHSLGLELEVSFHELHNSITNPVKEASVI